MIYFIFKCSENNFIQLIYLFIYNFECSENNFIQFIYLFIYNFECSSYKNSYKI